LNHIFLGFFSQHFWLPFLSCPSSLSCCTHIEPASPWRSLPLMGSFLNNPPHFDCVDSVQQLQQD
jgi:hypothetical protein